MVIKFKIQSFIKINSCELVFLAILFALVTINFINPMQICWILYVIIAIVVIRSLQFKEYVSNIIIDDQYFYIEYKFLGIKTNKLKILRSDIQKVLIRINSKDEKLNLKLSGSGCGTGTTGNFCESDINIITKNKNINFNVYPYPNFKLCNYDFIFKILDNKDLFPNLSLKLVGNSKFTYSDVEYYKKYGKRKSYFLCEMQNPKTREQFKLMFWTFLIVGSFFLIYIILLQYYNS